MYLIALLLPLVLFEPVLALGTSPDGKNLDLEVTYFVDFSTDENGGCKRYEDRIRRAWQDVPGLLQTAIRAMDDLQQSPPANDVPGQTEWKRKADTFFTQFGREIPTQGWRLTGVDDANRAARQVFLTLRSYLQTHTRTDGDPQRSYWLKCTDNWLQYLGPDEIDPTDDAKTRKIRENPEAVAVAQGDEIKGIYYAKVPPNGEDFFFPPDAQPNEEHLLCKSTTLATTIRGGRFGTRILTFCPTQLETADWRVSDSKLKLKRKDSYARFDSTIALTWIHEMGHYIKDWRDPRVDMKKLIKLPKQSVKQEVVYGWRNYALLAKQQPATAIEAQKTILSLQEPCSGPIGGG